MQPRITPSLPVDHEGSLSQKIFSGPGGIDPYSSAVSDVYQDLFQEGSYTGKGIYDIDAFESAMAGKVSENSVLSHDLFEGIFARVALATDIELFDEFPSRYEAVTARQHRWARGDWQLLPWLFGRGRSGPGKRKSVHNSRDRPLEDPRQSATYSVGTRRLSDFDRRVAAAIRFSLAVDGIHFRNCCDSCTPSVFHRTLSAPERYFEEKPFSRRAQRSGARRVPGRLDTDIPRVSGVADVRRDSPDPHPPLYNAQEFA